MTSIVFNVDSIITNHDESVYKAFRNLAVDKTIYGTIDRSYSTRDTDGLTVEETSLALIGIADVINWSFSQAEWTDDYDYDSVIKQGFLKNTAFTNSAGNWGEGGVAGMDRETGEITEPGFDKISITQSSPYDFTVGSMTTFKWDRENTIDGKATKDAKFELADFSEVAPRFVDFYTYGDSGTSFAAPRVAGLITHILQDNPDYDLNQIRTVLERNSDLVEFERDGNKWIAQVLDPYDLENNTIRDGRVGNSIDMFTDGITRDDYTFTFDTTHVIDTRTKVDGLYEIILGRNPDQGGLNHYVDNIESRNWSLHDVLTAFVNSEEGINGWFNSEDAEQTAMVPLIERVQALYHVGMSREPTLEETVNVIDYYKNEVNENWQQLVTDFVGFYSIDVNNMV
jgi:subtilisin family serine protease